MEKPKLAVQMTGLMLAGSLLLAGCTGNDEQAQVLATEVEQLKQDVAQLKSELAAMQSNYGVVAANLGGSDQVGALLRQVSLTDLDGYQTEQYIRDLAALGVFGDLSGQFEPDKTITRGEYVVWAFKAHNAIKPEAQVYLAPQLKSQFSDLKSDHPSYKYAQALANAGFSVGYDDGTFKPDQPITREELLGIKGSLDFGTMPPDPNAMHGTWGFSDHDKIDKRFSGYIAADGYDSKGGSVKRAFGNIKTFHPKQAVLRHEAAATLWKMRTGKYNSRTAAQAVEDKAKAAQAKN